MGVFITYRHKNGSVKSTVRAFAERLCSQGINVILDQLYLEEHPGGPPEGWDKWSSDNALRPGKVLIIGTPDWFDCFEKRQPPGKGLGAACEADDLRHRIFQANGIVEDIRVVLINDGHAKSISAKLDRYHRFHFERDFDNIVRWLNGASPKDYQPNNSSPSTPAAMESTNDDEDVTVKVQTVAVELTVKGDLSKLTEERKRAILGAIEKVLELDEDLVIKKIRRGSIKLTIELRADLAEKLKWAIESGALAELGVTDVTISERSNPSSESQIKESRIPKKRLRESWSMHQYLKEISKEAPIDEETEAALAERIKRGDNIALEELVKANLRFVVAVAKQYQNQGLSLPDLINEGNLGLIKAAQRYDSARGFRFMSYALWWIRQSMLQALAEQSRIVRVSTIEVGSLNKLNKALVKIEQEYERPPSAEELANLLDLPLERVIDTMKVSDARADGVPVPESLAKEIEKALSALTKLEREVVILFFGIHMTHSLTLEEIGAKLSLPRERVRRLKESAIHRLRHTTNSKLLKEYLS